MENMKEVITNLLKEQEERLEKNFAEKMEKFIARLEKLEHSVQVTSNKNDLKNLEKSN